MTRSRIIIALAMLAILIGIAWYVKAPPGERPQFLEELW